jgi:hypothetical protein
MNAHLTKMKKDGQRAAQNPQMAKAHKTELECVEKVIAWLEVRSISHWSPYDPVRVVNAVS